VESLSGFPSRYVEELENDAWYDTFKKAKAVVERGGNALLCGTRGGGKTRMAYEIAQRAVLPRHRGKAKRVFKTAMRIFLEIRSTYRRDSKESELDVIDNLTTCRLLVIDEVQERAESTFEAQKLTGIIDDRYRHKLPTILIANLTPEAFLETLGPSICDRCNEDGGLLEFTWQSFRK
jgi:DNA replication protein DnaC